MKKVKESDKKKENKVGLSSSFRDPSGFLFLDNGQLYRQVNFCYKEQYRKIIESGLYKRLTGENLLIPHLEIEKNTLPAWPNGAYKILKPKIIPLVSYPYEWCFSQLKDAALLTIKIQKIALRFGMSLKDASAFNVQFLDGKPVFIDTLSFERHKEGKPWMAYRQFCQHFLSPLSLAAKKDPGLIKLFRVYLDGIPLGFASKLLPFSTYFQPGLLLHIHIHARGEKRFQKIDSQWQREKIFGRKATLGLLDSLEGLVVSLKYPFREGTWSNYYSKRVFHEPSYFENKEKIVSNFLRRINSSIVWDIGANTGEFSKLAAKKGALVISCDTDHDCVNKNYLEQKNAGRKNILPLVIDIANPDPGLGWENEERFPFLARNPADTLIALALIHHLAFSNNLSLEKLALFFKKYCKKWLIIEFVPKQDIKAQELLELKGDIFPHYNQDNFEKAFCRYFEIREFSKTGNSERIIYLMKKK